MKGIISSNDFQYCSEIRKITRKVNNEIQPTNNIVATFKLPQLPLRVRVGFLSLNVRPYYPNPLRCFQCQRFGHSSKVCNAPEMCGSCSKDKHEDKCTNPIECYHCAGNHVSWSKECEIFKQEQAIVKIKVVNKVDYFEAKRIFQNTYTLIRPKERYSDVTGNRRKTQSQTTTRVTLSARASNIAPTTSHISATQLDRQPQLNTVKSAISPIPPYNTRSKSDILAPKNQLPFQFSSVTQEPKSAHQSAPTPTQHTITNQNTQVPDTITNSANINNERIPPNDIDIDKPDTDDDYSLSEMNQ